MLPPLYPDVRYGRQLIDATYALLLATSGEALVIPTMNRDGELNRTGHSAARAI